MVTASRDLAARVALRPVEVPADDEFLQRLYFDTRDDLSSFALPAEHIEKLLAMQYTAQKMQYEADFPNAGHYIIELDGRCAGRYMISRRPDDILLVDIAVLTELRGQGIGSFVLQCGLHEARREGKAYRLHVLRHSRAHSLYERLGFIVTAESPSHYEMEWGPLNA
jgi:GNAT superfamily N-acetyltransferase